MKDKIVISVSINKDIDKWLKIRSEEWRCSKSWLVENLLFAAMVRSGALPDANEQRPIKH